MQRFIDITGALAHLQKVFPEDHPDIINLRAAFHEIFDNPEVVSKLESFAPYTGPSNLGDGNPYENDDFDRVEGHFDQQMQTIENAFEEPVFEEPMPYSLEKFDEQQEMVIERLPDDTLPQESL